MKNFILFIFLIVQSTIFSQSCTHTISLTDTYGDGWNGGTVSVSVNGATVLTNIGLPTGLGPSNFTFSASAGSTIRVFRTAAGSYPSEMRIKVLNGIGTILINTIQPVSGTSTTLGQTCVGSCAAPTPPSNDLVCNAISITCGSTTAGTTINATNSGTGEAITCGNTQTQPGVWYKIIGTGAVMTVSLCGTIWDSKIDIFTGTCTSLSCVGGNDDSGPACTGTSSSYAWSSVVGVTYWIKVHGYSSTSSFSISLTCVAPPTSGPCTNTTAYGTQALPIFGDISYTTVACAFAGEYSTWSGAVINTPYIVTSTISTDWITVRSGTSNGSIIAYGNQSLSITPSTNDVIYIHVNADSYCATQSTCRDITVSRISALPVELLFFEGKKLTNSNMLYWSTASEHNSSHFIVEKSEDGYSWRNIGQIPSSINSIQQLDYSILDDNVSPFINYYRLHQYDIDGNNEIFGPIVIDNQKSFKTIVKTINLAGQEVGENASGMVIEIYEDGNIKRIIK